MSAHSFCMRVVDTESIMQIQTTRMWTMRSSAGRYACSLLSIQPVGAMITAPAVIGSHLCIRRHLIQQFLLAGAAVQGRSDHDDQRGRSRSNRRGVWERPRGGRHADLPPLVDQLPVVLTAWPAFKLVTRLSRLGPGLLCQVATVLWGAPALAVPCLGALPRQSCIRHDIEEVFFLEASPNL